MEIHYARYPKVFFFFRIFRLFFTVLHIYAGVHANVLVNRSMLVYLCMYIFFLYTISTVFTMPVSTGQKLPLYMFLQ